MTRGSSQFFESDRFGMEAAGPCLLFLYYQTLQLSISSQSQKIREVETTPDLLGIKNLTEPILPLLLSLYRSIRGKVMQWQIECEKKITRMRENNAQEQDKYYCKYKTLTGCPGRRKHSDEH